MKLITPIGLLVTTALLAIYAIAAAKVALMERSWPLAAAAAFASVACIGTAFMRRWSRHLVYALTAGFIAKWCWSVYDGYRAGYFGFEFGSTTAAMKPLLPGLTLVTLSCLCSSLVYSHFRQSRRRPAA